MVFNPTKYIILGLGVLTAAFFFKEAAGTSLTSTLARTGGAGVNLGEGIGAVGAGVGQFGVRALDPFFSLADLFSKFGNLFGGGSGETVTSTTNPAIITTGGTSYKVGGGSIGTTGGGTTGGGPTGGGPTGGGPTGGAPTGGTTGGGIAGGTTGGGGRPNPRGKGGRGR